MSEPPIAASAAPPASGTLIRDAVTAVLLHQGQVFLARRDQKLLAFPGYQAFPGGKVDRGDGEVRSRHVLAENQPPRLLHALHRELLEELGFDLFAALDAGDVEALDELGIAITPAFVPVRFRTHFFRILLARRPEFALDAAELADGEWHSPGDWLARYARGELLLAPPTLTCLEALAADPAATAVPALGRFETETGIPHFEPVAGLRQIFVRSATLPPAEHTNAFLIGDAGARRLLVDPSPRDEAEYGRLCEVIAGRGGCDEVFLTHHHPDHRQRADALARRLGVPIGLSADTRVRIAARSPRFFDGIEVIEHADGEDITRWLGRAVRVLAVPGHDEGQLALMPEDRAWCIVGDLIQGIGTVVIAAPEGDMAKYFATLERVIALAPRVIIPSHGPALGGVHYLAQTLAHRRTREAQIRSLIEAGKTIDETLGEVYKGLDPRLLPLARMNIESHLVKLKGEGLDLAV